MTVTSTRPSSTDDQIGGRRPAQGAARSSWPARLSTSASSAWRPTNCTPIGRPDAAHRQRDAGRRLAGDVEGLGVGHEGEEAARVALPVRRIAALQVADRHRRHAERRADQDVVASAKKAATARPRPCAARSELDVERAGDLAAALVARPGDRLDLVLGDRPAALDRHRVEVGRDAGRDHHAGGGQRRRGRSADRPPRPGGRGPHRASRRRAPPRRTPDRWPRRRRRRW